MCPPKTYTQEFCPELPGDCIKTVCDPYNPGLGEVTIKNCFDKKLKFAVAEYTDPHSPMKTRVCSGKRWVACVPSVHADVTAISDQMTTAAQCKSTV